MMPTVGWTFVTYEKLKPNIKYQLKFGGVAQLGEHLPCKQGVRSSILLISTTQWMEKGEGSTLNSCSGKEKWAYSSAG